MSYGNNDDFERSMKELMACGIIPDEDILAQKDKDEATNAELKLINDMETISGVKYSEEQKQILMNKDSSCIIACAGSGKALANGTGVLTPNGYVAIEKLEIGDKVFDETGKTQKVIGVFPQGKKRVYEIQFNTGETIECCKDHLWTVKDGQYWVVLNTLDIMKSLNEIKGKQLKIPRIDFGDFEIANVNKQTYIRAFEKAVGNREKWQKVLANEDIDINIEAFARELNDYSKNVGELFFRYMVTSSSYIYLKGDDKELLNMLKEAYNYFGYTFEYITRSIKLTKIHIGKIDETNNERSIISVKETNKFAEMTCIKVTGMNELFTIEHNIITHNTTVLTNLIAKRIMSGEIKDSNKIVCTTYSKGGATEMEDRLHALLGKFGIDRRIKVVTMHAFFLSILKTCCFDMPVVKEGKRLQFIREAAKESDFTLRDEDLADLSNLISFQINNLMTDEVALKSEANTFDDLTIEKYQNIRKLFNIKKIQARCMDFDDMQLWLWKWLVRDRKSDNEAERNTSLQLRRYCNAMWDYFYIDEAQDISKIQYEIIREMITDENDRKKLSKHLTFVGDDDQCLLGSTKIITPEGTVELKDIKIGDKVLAAVGHGQTKYCLVDNVSKLEADEVLRITTDKGTEIVGTANHVGFVRLNNIETKANLMIKLFDSDNTRDGIVDSSYTSITDKGKIKVTAKLNYVENHYKQIKNARKHGNIIEAQRIKIDKDREYAFVEFGDMQAGDVIPVYKDGKLVDEKIQHIVKEENTEKYVYDISVPEARNFIADDVVVHNCIYKWRGADPSIILNIGNKFDMKLLMLSTNYRCKENIVDFAANSVKNNSARYAKSMKAFNKGGDIKIIPSEKNGLNAMSDIALAHIEKLIANGDSPNDICVMSRNNMHLAILGNKLLYKGIFSTANVDMRLTNSSMYKDAKMMLNFDKNNYDREITRNILWRLCRYMSVAQAGVIAKSQDATGLSGYEILKYMLSSYGNKEAYKIDRKINIPMQVDTDLRISYRRLSYDTVSDIENIVKLLELADDQRIVGLFHMYMQSAGALLYKRADKRRSITGLFNYMSQMVKTIGFEQTKDFLRITEQYESGTMDVGGEKVTLTTVHSAKGKEWKNVIAFAVDNVTMPSAEDIKLAIAEGHSLQDINGYIDEERRLYYVETTRAKNNLLIITSLSDPSVFLLESLDCIKDPGKIGTNQMLIDSMSDDNYVASTQRKNLFDFDKFRSLTIEPGAKYKYE